MKRLLVLLVLVAAAWGGWTFRDEIVRRLPAWLIPGSPHDRYVHELRRTGLADTPAGTAWLAAAGEALRTPAVRPIVFSREAAFDETRRAESWLVAIRRGQRLTIDVTGLNGPVFIDLFDRDGESRVASAPEGSSLLTFEVEQDAHVVARVQAAIGVDGAFDLEQRAEATLTFPVEGVTPRAIGGVWGDPRDAGRRAHEGVDIFARRGTPALAAADGVVTDRTTNRLGGNVVWIHAAGRGLSFYYAHLDRQAVSPGDRVEAGDVVGYVGTTGNARGSPPHLHFGIYARPGGAVDPLPFVCDPPCGERLMQQLRPADEGDS